MITVRKSEDRGRADHGWLKSFHSFSFAQYYDPEFLHFGALRVINDDRVAPGGGFGTHPHRDMEIISYVLDGELAHKDSMGNGSVISAGDVQCMSAGRGVLHSEFNQSTDNEVHFLQIWIEPREKNTLPDYQQKHYTDEQKRGRLALIASPDGAEGSLRIRQDARVMAGLFDQDERADYVIDSNRKAYVHVARGDVAVNGLVLHEGDAAMLTDKNMLSLEHGRGAEVLVFDLA